MGLLQGISEKEVETDTLIRSDGLTTWAGKLYGIKVAFVVGADIGYNKGLSIWNCRQFV